MTIKQIQDLADNVLRRYREAIKRGDTLTASILDKQWRRLMRTYADNLKHGSK